MENDRDSLALLRTQSLFKLRDALEIVLSIWSACDETDTPSELYNRVAAELNRRQEQV